MRDVNEIGEKGGKGGEDLARAVSDLIASGRADFTPMYSWNLPIRQKIEAVATKIYGAARVDYSTQARRDLRRIKKLGLEHLPVCIAKTQKSLSDNAKLIGCPRDFTITVREIEIAAGAGFVVPITGVMMRMPGLPSEPSAIHIDVDKHGNISGLF